jgi:crotonobetainyl-CoA:carnitine CoA-transferase CaiB-like acyl-CoA transferase
MTAPLAGVRVVEIANYVSVPYGTMMLADLGADVLKVEPPGGDPFRRFGRPRKPMSALFTNVNRGKRSVVLDLKDPSGRGALLRLLDDADVVVSNWRPGVAARLHLEDAVFRDRNPRLIRAYVSGFGSTGPDAARPTFDSVIQARSGMAWAQGDHGAPALAVGYLVDKLTAAMLAQAVVAALYERTRTGVGDAIDIAMLDVAAYLGFPDLLAERTYVDLETDDARNAQMSANRPLRARDGWFVLNAVSGTQIKSAATALGHPEWGEELLAKRDGAQLTRRLLELVEAETKAMPLRECLARFEAHDVACAPCAGPDEHLADPQVVHNQLYDVVDQPGVGPVRRVRYPAVSARWGMLRAARPAPFLDDDGDTVRGE